MNNNAITEGMPSIITDICLLLLRETLEGQLMEGS